ncbi:MAG: SLBB domain-containing protein [Deltaproteobacteria bacterium]|jgi:Na+-translocating ferredoxin:NAD+ oxidoreductase RnfC subunit|nr:SLBB domain-containing protein [Deltaproteobacteria bacterium]
MTKDAFITAVRTAGIVGEGGAGFPAHVKFAAAADTVIANGCECEPLLHTDQHHMAHHAQGIARALAGLASATGAKRGVFALKNKQRAVIPLAREACGMFGLELALLDDFYPAGDEQILVRELTGKSTPPLGIPLQVGCIVANVGTLASVDAAVQHGRSVTHKSLTVTGEVKQPGIVRVPLGTAMNECLAAAGGALVKEPVFILGGPMMGRIIVDQDALGQEVVTKTSGGLIVLPSGHYLHRNAAQTAAAMRRRAAAACIQCRICSDLCPRMLIGHPFETHKVMRAFGSGVELESEAGTLAHLCCECGVCEHYACPMQLSPRRVNQTVKAALRATNTAFDGSRALREEYSTWRSLRKVPVQRLAARLDIARYMHLETPDLGVLTPAAVRIPLLQHIGMPAQAQIKPGDKVRAGQCIGEIPEKGLGARIHASLDGTVTAVDNAVTIQAE